jgi:hypothetical protein
MGYLWTKTSQYMEMSKVEIEETKWDVHQKKQSKMTVHMTVPVRMSGRMAWTPMRLIHLNNLSKGAMWHPD